MSDVRSCPLASECVCADLHTHVYPYTHANRYAGAHTKKRMRRGEEEEENKKNYSEFSMSIKKLNIYLKNFIHDDTCL